MYIPTARDDRTDNDVEIWALDYLVGRGNLKKKEKREEEEKKREREKERGKRRGRVCEVSWDDSFCVMINCMQKS